MKRAQLLCLALTLLPCVPLGAQVLTFSREQLIDYTRNNPFDRSADGRPKVPDDLLQRALDVSIEDVWDFLAERGYHCQFEGGWKALHVEKP